MDVFQSSDSFLPMPFDRQEKCFPDNGEVSRRGKAQTFPVVNSTCATYDRFVVPFGETNAR